MTSYRESKKTRRGLTVPEVVVVTIIVLVVVGIVLTAIPRMRETAHREQCANNLRQIGVATRKFRDIKHFLPAARIADRYATWAIQIVPYLSASGADPLHAWDLHKSYYAQPDQVRAAQVVLYYCPS